MRGGAKANGVRRCVRSGFGTVSARTPSNSGHSFSLKILCAVIVGEARHDCCSQYNADADVV